METTLSISTALTDNVGAIARADTGDKLPAPLFCIPQADLHCWGALPDAVKDEVKVLLDVMRQIHQRGSVDPVCRELEKLFHGKRGFAWRSLRRKWYAFVARGWRALVDWSKAAMPAEGEEARGLSPAFKQWFKALVESNQRKTRPAIRVFRQRWLAGETIPVDAKGRCTDEAFNAQSRHCLPPGCTEGNLYKIAKDAFALTAMRQGLGKAMAQHGPKIFTTRVGLWPMSHVMIDDLWHDNFVVYRGDLVRVLEFDALEILSGCKIGWGTKPRRQREDGSFEGLPEKFVRMLLAQIFFQHGYSPQGTTILAEHGTAAVREELERLLHDRSGGKIAVRRSGMTGKEQAVAGMFRGRGGGNPRFKSALESLRNLIHNELAALPAQTGKDRDHKPESLDGELKHNADLLKAIAVLHQVKPERAELIQLSVLQYHSQFLPLLADVYETINRRDWHELEGWHQCGFVVPQLNDGGRWVSPEALVPAKREALLALAKLDRGYVRDVRLSPREVFNRGRGRLEKIPASVVAEILGRDFASEVACRNSYFEITDGELDADGPLRFESRVTAPDGSERELAADTYLVTLNPFDLRQLFVADARGRHIGMARRVQASCKADETALQREFGRRNQRLADLLTPIRARHGQMTRAAALRDRVNAEAIAGAGFRPAVADAAPGVKNAVTDCTEEILSAPAVDAQAEDWQ